MITRKEFLGGLYSLPLTLRDKTKLGSGFDGDKLKHVMVMYAHGMGDLPWLLGNGHRYAIRVDEGDYATSAKRAEVRNTFRRLTPNQRAGLEFVTIGVEPEGHLDFSWGSKTGWGNEVLGDDRLTDMERHRRAFNELRTSLQNDGIKVCSPGYRCRDIDGRKGAPPTDGPQPGYFRWSAHMLSEYGAAEYNGSHFYGYDGTAYDVEHRAARYFNKEISIRQREIILDEINVGNRHFTKEECMAGTLNIAEEARHTGRVVRAYIFVFNGTPYNDKGEEQWPPNQLVDSDPCYGMLAKWLSETGVD